MFETKSGTVPITQEMVKSAYQKVKSNGGSAGVDKESLEEFQADLHNNLYKLWNRLSSGSYFPKAVREVAIPKASGGNRKKRTKRGTDVNFKPNFKDNTIVGVGESPVGRLAPWLVIYCLMGNLCFSLFIRENLNYKSRLYFQFCRKYLPNWRQNKLIN